MNCLLFNNYRLLNLYCEIFGTSSYGEGCTRYMNECQISHNLNSITFLASPEPKAR